MATTYSHAAFRGADRARVKGEHRHAHFSALQWIGILATTSWMVVVGAIGVFYIVMH